MATKSNGKTGLGALIEASVLAPIPAKKSATLSDEVKALADKMTADLSIGEGALQFHVTTNDDLVMLRAALYSAAEHAGFIPPESQRPLIEGTSKGEKVAKVAGSGRYFRTSFSGTPENKNTGTAFEAGDLLAYRPDTREARDAALVSA